MINKVLVHVLVVAVVLFMLLGCDKAPAKQESKPESNHIKTPTKQMENLDKEDLFLISIKYKVDAKVLNEIIEKYEKMTGINVLWGESDTFLSVQEAIKDLSQKYKIQEEVLASILIDKKSMESHED